MTDSNPYDQLNSPYLSELGFNLQAVLHSNCLPNDVLASLPDQFACLQSSGFSILMLGNGGNRFWQRFQESEFAHQANHPVDRYSVSVAGQFVLQRWPQYTYHVLYPEPHPVALQRLGELAGWHHDSPIKVGINSVWGTWFAYRAVLLIEANLQATLPVQADSPCTSCQQKPCLNQCPSNALGFPQEFLERCLPYRLQPNSACQSTCLAREACPVQAQHRYSRPQIEYHYLDSLQTIKSL